MYAVAILDENALAAFRREHPWLDLAEDVQEISIYFDDNGGPTRLTAHAGGQDGTPTPVDAGRFGLEAILALIRFAPQGRPAVEDCPEEAEVRTILETLPILRGGAGTDELERERAARLEDAYQIVRQIAAAKFTDLLKSATDMRERERLQDAASRIPETLVSVDDRHKPMFLEVDLWRLVAVIRDEFSLPADYEMTPSIDDDLLGFPDKGPAAAPVMSDPVIQALFDLSPVAFSISSTGEKNSRYVRVNQAYLDLVGKTWDEIQNSEMVSSGVVVGSDARTRRLMLLDRHGGYTDEIAEIRGASGEMIPVQISARRLSLGGQLYDFEVLTRLSDS
ncbi:diguanylate cyclase [Ciceribacter sp. L1K22]|uniref:diguanylate cyclase n=1 Tax=Ciceribacter sp. L1K22 TaxID=2820275 RepID=UPI001ABDDFCD|nr:diguanylate cyclase [Ciceribacter sp. L1K22]MBO3759226.1 diguanylate cyclase [Ciceribacter sp. L1K22]